MVIAFQPSNKISWYEVVTEADMRHEEAVESLLRYSRQW